MTPDDAHPSERLYVKRWPNAKRELISLAMDESMGRVRPEFAAWIRNERRERR